MLVSDILFLTKETCWEQRQKQTKGRTGVLVETERWVGLVSWRTVTSACLYIDWPIHEWLGTNKRFSYPSRFAPPPCHIVAHANKESPPVATPLWPRPLPCSTQVCQSAACSRATSAPGPQLSSSGTAMISVPDRPSSRRLAHRTGGRVRWG